jgi:hypothetical protein
LDVVSIHVFIVSGLLEIAVCWVVMPCSLVDRCQHIAETCYLCHWGRWSEKCWYHIPNSEIWISYPFASSVTVSLSSSLFVLA